MSGFYYLKTLSRSYHYLQSHNILFISELNIFFVLIPFMKTLKNRRMKIRKLTTLFTSSQWKKGFCLDLSGRAQSEKKKITNVRKKIK